MTNRAGIFQNVAVAVGLGVLAGGIRLAQRRRRAVSFEGRTVVITGGSRGLGLVIARELAEEGARLVLLSRDEDELARAAIELREAGASVETITCDVRVQAEVDRAIRQAASAFDGIDVLINNAGIIQVGPFEHMTVGDFQEAMATHFWGPLYAMLAALPYLRQSDTRRIVNVSSIGGKVAVPHLLPYSASKFALAGLSAGLRAELAREGICVTSVYPGLMRTGSTYNARFKGRHQQEFGWFHVADSTPGLSIDVRRAARQVINACRHGDGELIITLSARLAVVLQALCPNTMGRLMAATNQWALPRPAGREGDSARSGWQSVSRYVPSPLTRLADRATAANNQIPGDA